MPGRLLLLTLLLVAPRTFGQDAVRADWVLQGGTLYDGSGGEPVVGDLAIHEGKIVAIGKFKHTGGQVIDCSGLVVCPGFIDLHNHSDKPIIRAATRGNVNYLTQGCTTVVTGNCGAGPIDVAAYFKKLDAHGAGTNIAHLLPQGALRAKVVGNGREKASPEQIVEMQRLAERAMQDGAVGMSTGLIYVPGTYSDTDELSAIASVIGKHSGIYASHIRNEATGLLDAIREALEIGRRGKLPVHISHFKANGVESWGNIRAAAEVIEQARASGQVVTADQYPYHASSTSIEAMLIPTRYRAGGNKALLARIDDKQTGPAIRQAIRKSVEQRGTKAPIRIARYRPRPDWVGKTLLEVAAAEQRDPVDVVVEIQRHGGASGVSFGMQEEDVRFAMQLPWVATASDGAARLPSDERPHPRSFGTFPRKIGYYAIELKVLPLSQAIRSSSGLPADILGLTDRGYLKPGLAADVTVFDPEQFRDRATFDQPFRYSQGVRWVFVNGTPAISEGTPTGALAGKALRKKP